MDAEQTWPTEEELAEAAANRKKKIVKVVPKGTSEYQAAWIPDEDGGITYSFNFSSSLFLSKKKRNILIVFNSLL